MNLTILRNLILIMNERFDGLLMEVDFQRRRKNGRRFDRGQRLYRQSVQSVGFRGSNFRMMEFLIEA